MPVDPEQTVPEQEARGKGPRTLRAWSVRILWEPRDLWLGAFRDTDKGRLYVCLLPCLPIVIERGR